MSLDSLAASVPCASSRQFGMWLNAFGDVLSDNLLKSSKALHHQPLGISTT